MPTALVMGKDVQADKCPGAPAGRDASLHHPPPRENLTADGWHWIHLLGGSAGPSWNLGFAPY